MQEKFMSSLDIDKDDVKKAFRSKASSSRDLSKGKISNNKKKVAKKWIISELIDRREIVLVEEHNK